MMDSDEFEHGGQEAAPIDMLAAYFEAHGWTYEQVGEDEIVANTQGSWAQYELRGIWRDEDQVLQLLALPDIRVTDEKRGTIYEALGLINEQLWLGHFELWSSSGIILFRHGALLGDDGMLSIAQAQALIENAVDECDRFYPAFQFAFWGGKSPADALDAAMIDAAGEA